jgi:hypothetical protein
MPELDPAYNKRNMLQNKRFTRGLQRPWPPGRWHPCNSVRGERRRARTADVLSEAWPDGLARLTPRHGAAGVRG